MPETQTVVSIAGDRFLIGGKLTNRGRSWKGMPIEGLLFNSRMANAIIYDDNPATRGVWAYLDGEFSAERNTREFIAALPDYHAHGLRAVSINVQGGSPQGYSWNQPWRTSGFLPDGTIKPDYVKRLDDVVTACDRLGMVVIDFATRRRLRINGVVTRADSAGLELQVRETFGNCPKYIQRRECRQTGRSEGPVLPTVHGRVLDDERRAFVARTDTLFVASINAERGLDASHRGGEPGFVHVIDDVTLRLPDYEGNSMYQTLGNFQVDSRAGLALVDFERRRVLSLTGDATTEFGADDPRQPTGGTGRYWSFRVRRWVEFSLTASMGWRLLDRSPFNPPRAL